MAQDDAGIHPTPTEFSQAQISSDPILHFFHYAHLPPKLQVTSQLFFMLAKIMVETLPRNAERSVALRKLLEAKDAAVRANLPQPNDTRPLASNNPQPIVKTNFSDPEQSFAEPVETGGHDEDRDGPVPFNG